MRTRARGTRAWLGVHLSSGDRLAIVLLCALPIALYVPLSLAGHPVIPGDNLYQNEPLRALAGRIIASGRVPAWNPLMWTGTPLLAGWNAGAMFPGTWLFAFVPAVAAWTVNFAATPIIAATGMYVFIRQLRCRPLGAALGALVFTYTGFFSGQAVHIGLEQGTAITPWIPVGLGVLMGATTRGALAASIALTGSAMALVVLAGDPRAVSSAAVIVIVDVAARLSGRGVARARLLLGTAAAGLLGAALAGAQWWPGISFLHSSQRASAAYGFFSSGSLNFHTLFSNLLLPFLVGTNGNFGLPSYDGNYNLPEVTIGVGLVALCAALAYLPEVLVRAARWRRRPLATSARRLGVFYVLGALGVLLTLGSTTPLGHLLVHIPLYGGERLQNRNAAIFDFALAAVLAYFVDDVASGRSPLVAHDGATARPGDEGPALGPGPMRWSKATIDAVRLATILPCVAAIVLVVLAYLDPAHLAQALQAGSTATFDRLGPYLVPTAVLAGAIAVFVFLAPKLSRRTCTVLVSAFVACDLATFVLNESFSTVPSEVLATHTTLADALAQQVGPSGRFALYNGSQLSSIGSEANARLEIGIPDLNVIHDEPSVQGYGSIVNGTYQDVTQTHLFGSLDAGRLNGETFDTLDLRTLVAPLPYLGEVIPDHAGVPIATTLGHTRSGPGVVPPPPKPAGPWPLVRGHPDQFFLPAASAIARVTVTLNHTGHAYPPTLTLTATGSGAPVTVTRPVGSREVVFRFSAGTPVSSLLVAEPGATSALIGAVVVVTAHPSLRVLLDGALQGTMTSPHWTYGGTLGGFTLFVNHDTRGFAWLQPASSTTPNVTAPSPGELHLLANSATAPQVMIVHATAPAQLVRSEGYSPGWTARVTPVGGGPTTVVPVHRFGLVQAVAIGTGDYRVTFRYAPVSLLKGLVSSALGFLALVALVDYALTRGRRARTAGRTPRARRRSGRRAPARAGAAGST